MTMPPSSSNLHPIANDGVTAATATATGATTVDHNPNGPSMRLPQHRFVSQDTLPTLPQPPPQPQQHSHDAATATATTSPVSASSSRASSATVATAGQRTPVLRGATTSPTTTTLSPPPTREQERNDNDDNDEIVLHRIRAKWYSVTTPHERRIWDEHQQTKQWQRIGQFLAVQQQQQQQQGLQQPQQPQEQRTNGLPQNIQEDTPTTATARPRETVEEDHHREPPQQQQQQQQQQGLEMEPRTVVADETGATRRTTTATTTATTPPSCLLHQFQAEDPARFFVQQQQQQQPLSSKEEAKPAAEQEYASDAQSILRRNNNHNNSSNNNNNNNNTSQITSLPQRILDKLPQLPGPTAAANTNRASLEHDDNDPDHHQHDKSVIRNSTAETTADNNNIINNDNKGNEHCRNGPDRGASTVSRKFSPQPSSAALRQAKERDAQGEGTPVPDAPYYPLDIVLNSNLFFWVGRGGYAITHSGNSRVRGIICSKADDYAQLKRSLRGRVAKGLLQTELRGTKFVIPRDVILQNLQQDQEIARRGGKGSRKVGATRKKSLLDRHESIAQIESYPPGVCIEVGYKWAIDIVNHQLREEDAARGHNANLEKKQSPPIDAQEETLVPTRYDGSLSNMDQQQQQALSQQERAVVAAAASIATTPSDQTNIPIQKHNVSTSSMSVGDEDAVAALLGLQTTAKSNSDNNASRKRTHEESSLSRDSMVTETIPQNKKIITYQV